MSLLQRADELTRMGRVNVAVAGVYAWGTTVVIPATAASASLPARVAAGVALVPLIAGLWIAGARPRLGRRVGVYGFVGGCALAWVLNGSAIDPARLDPVRASLGGLGWAFFVFGWGTIGGPGPGAAADRTGDAGSSLQPREHLPSGATGVVTLAIMAAVMPWLVAWQVVHSERALLAHAAALACAIGVVSGGSRIALERGRWRPVSPPIRRLRAAAWSLVTLGVVALLGLLRLLLD